MRSDTKDLLLKAGGAALVFAMAVGVCALEQVTFTAADGAEYLEKRGYTDVSGGKVAAFSACDDHELARKYTATNKDGKTVHKTVCNGIFGPYSPLFQ